MKKKILIIGMFDSIHLARWLNQFKSENFDFYLYPSKKHRFIHSGIIALLNQPNFMLYGFNRMKRLEPYLDFVLNHFIANRLSKNIRSARLKKILTAHNFYRIHSLEIQGAGYLCLDVSDKFNFEDKLIITNWGSDIFYFASKKLHIDQIKKCLAIATYYSAECQRDYELAIKYGFVGKFLPCNPNSGGISQDFILKPDLLNVKKDKILVKGYGGEFGQVKVAIPIIEKILKNFLSYSVHYYSVTDDIEEMVKLQVKKFSGRVTYSTVGRPRSYKQMSELFAESKFYLGLSLSDGISTSFLEALSKGVFPIQSNTSCANEWILKGFNGSIVDLDSFQIYNELVRLISDYRNLEILITKNLELCKSELSVEKIAKESMIFYR
jgi:glycosyltransferase involved in cell wall biosynthesis